MIRALLDSDVILDYVLNRQPFHGEAEKIFEALASIKFVGYVSAIALLNVHYFAEKKQDRAFALIEIKQLLKVLEVVSIDENSFHVALTLGFNDYEDAVQCASAAAEALDAIVTRNKKDFENSPLPVCSPAEFIALIQTKPETDESN